MTSLHGLAGQAEPKAKKKIVRSVLNSGAAIKADGAVSLWHCVDERSDAQRILAQGRSFFSENLRPENFAWISKVTCPKLLAKCKMLSKAKERGTFQRLQRRDNDSGDDDRPTNVHPEHQDVYANVEDEDTDPLGLGFGLEVGPNVRLEFGTQAFFF